MADFSQVQCIHTMTGDNNKGQVQLRIAGASEPLTVTLFSLDKAEDIADLVDGYCRLVHETSGTLWTCQGLC